MQLWMPSRSIRPNDSHLALTAAPKDGKDDSDVCALAPLRAPCFKITVKPMVQYDATQIAKHVKTLNKRITETAVKVSLASKYISQF